MNNSKMTVEKAIDYVKKFHVAFGVPVNDEPTVEVDEKLIISYSLPLNLMNLIIENCNPSAKI